MQAIGATPTEFGMAQVGDAAEHGRDPAPGPSDRVFDVRKRARAIRRSREAVEQLAHQITATVVEALDLCAIVHRVLWRVLSHERTDGVSR